jgi:hypothetical protein
MPSPVKVSADVTGILCDTSNFGEPSASSDTRQ